MMAIFECSKRPVDGEGEILLLTWGEDTSWMATWMLRFFDSVVETIEAALLENGRMSHFWICVCANIVWNDASVRSHRTGSCKASRITVWRRSVKSDATMILPVDDESSGILGICLVTISVFSRAMWLAIFSTSAELKR